ncbi:response regulator transcription factor [Candidatus Woesebacteria bacterium]|nr:response regulator transcription factor [Candidatus Woesebacteria bacterium]
MRILLVEDDHKISSVVKRGLEQESFAVDTAFNGEDGYDLGLSEEYDVIILDLMLPLMDGIEVCKKLRQEKISTPILMLTAKSQISDKVFGLNVGADDYLSKPFAFDELVARIRALSRRPKKSIDNVLIIDDLKLDQNRFYVSRNDNHINLSKKEFSLLEYLMKNKNRVLTKEQIISNVWNYDADILPNTVEVYIGYLRNKIDKPFKNKLKLIKTVRGFGYKIEDKV